MTGKSSSGSFIAKICNNGDSTNNPKNTKPSAPINLQQTVTSDSVTLYWGPATDTQTPEKGLSYNIRVGKTPGGIDIISPMSSVTDGFRRIPAMGNAGHTKEGYTIYNLQEGLYYWSVQAIDNAFAGGAWAPEKMFEICYKPSIQASDIQLSHVTDSTADLSWTNGNGAKRAVFMKQGEACTANPLSHGAYSQDTTFIDNTQILTDGWYCMFNGTESSVHISGLDAKTEYCVMVIEYNGSQDFEKYQTSQAIGNPVTFTTNEKFISNDNINFYPNPAKDYIEVQSRMKPCLLNIIDSNGKEVVQKQMFEKVEQFNITDLPNGLYLLKLQTNNEVKVFKLLVQ